jgi:hypothetical protein
MNTKILVSLLLGMWMGTFAFGQDPIKTSPQYYKVLLENDQVRVLDYRLKPAEKEHSHPASVVYVLGGGTFKFSYPDGRTEEKTAATGETIWRDPVTTCG